MTVQAWHRCDPQINVNTADTPLSHLRMLKIARAWLTGDTAEIETVDAELGDCPKCLRQTMSCAIGFAIRAFCERPGSPADHVMALELDIAATEAKLR